jgi:transcriptional regulator with GAF, ATPase, and Fis domain
MGESVPVSRPRKERYRAPADPEEERRRIVDAMRKGKGVRTDAARTLGMTRQLLWMKIIVHRIRGDEWRESGGVVVEGDGTA